MPTVIDLTGKRIGNLEVIRRVPSSTLNSVNTEVYWLCRCDCGIEEAKRSTALLHRDVTSCRECGWERGTKKKQAHRQRLAKATAHPLYGLWTAIKTRCRHHPDYVAQGITVSKEFLDFWTFIEALGERPTPEHTVDRIDVSRGYERGNIRWATCLEQAQNRRSTIWVEYLGRRQTASEWSRELGIERNWLYRRLKRGDSLETIHSAYAARKSTLRMRNGQPQANQEPL